MKAPIRPFGPDLWRDIALTLERVHQPFRTIGRGFGAFVFEEDPAPYLHHIRDRVLEHRAAELRPLLSGAEHVAKIAKDRIDDSLMLAE